MKKIWKQTLAILLTVVLVVGTVTASGGANFEDGLLITASAESSGKCGENVYWSLSDDGVLSITGSGKMYDYDYSHSVPWYAYRSSVKSVEIQNGITNIGDYSFAWCSFLEKIQIPNTVTVIGNHAFEYSGLTEATIPNSVIKIGEDAFSSCRNLQVYNIPDSVIEIGDFAFSYSGIEEIIIPDSVKKTGLRPFGHCNSVTRAYIGAGLAEIGDLGLGLASCEKMKSILVDKNNSFYRSENNCLIDIKNKTCIDGCATSVIPSDGSVVCIGSCAFEGCVNLVSIRLPDCITKIDSGAFQDCSNLKSINLPESLNEIDTCAFQDCKSLESVILPDRLEIISNAAFAGCVLLKTITIPKNVRYIGKNPFMGSSWRGGDDSSLESITVDPQNTRYHSSGNCLIGFGQLIAGCNNSIIPSDGSVREINIWAFYGCRSLTRINIPVSIRVIDYQVFENCDNLTDIDYDGTKEQWNAIEIDSDNDNLQSVTIHYNAAGGGTEEPGEEPQTEPDGMRVIVNNTNLSYTEGDYVVIAVSDFKNDTESKIEKLSVKTSDSGVLKVEQIYDFSDLPSFVPFTKFESVKKCKFIVLKAVSEGSAFVSVTNSSTGETRYVPILVSKKDLVSIRRINNLQTWDLGGGDTYVGSACGVFIESIGYQRSGDNYLLSMNIYNQNHCPGAIEVYDGNGKLQNIKIIEKFESFDTGILKTFQSGYVIIKELFEGKTFSYKSEKLSKETKIENLSVPKDGYIRVTCDYETSPYCAAIQYVDWVFTAISVTKSIDKIATGIEDLGKKETKKIEKSFIQYILKNEKVVQKFAKKFAKKLGKSVIKNYTLFQLKEDLQTIVNDGLPTLEELLENMGINLDTLLKVSLGSAVSVGEGVLTKLMAGYGIVINSLFAAEDIYDFGRQIYDMNHLRAGIPAFVGYMPANGDTTVLKNENVSVSTNGKVPSETVLESYRVIYGNANYINLKTGETYSEYEEYEIALVNDGQYIQPTGEVEVYIDSPYEKAVVARQKADGTWEIIPSTLSNGLLRFMVNHFCRFAVLDDASAVRPTIAIRNFMTDRAVDYRTTITFTADVTNAVDGAAVHWFIDGQDKGTGETFEWKEAKQSYTVQAKYVKGSEILAESESENVTVKTGFFAKLKAFFRALFGRLPKVVQEYLGVEIIDRVLP